MVSDMNGEILVPVVVSAHAFLLQEVMNPSVQLSVSPLLGTAICPGPSSLVYPRKVVDFSVFVAFYVLGQSGDFQVSYVWNH